MKSLNDLFGSLGHGADDTGLNDLLAALPQPPHTEALRGITGAISAALSGEPCPGCGKHRTTEELLTGASPQIPAYNESSGLPGEYEYAPRAQSAIQLLAHNVVDVLKFLYERAVPFGYTVDTDDNSRILLVTPGSETYVEDTDELVYGRWAVVRGSRETGDLAYAVLDDELFRSMFQEKKSPRDADETTLNELGDEALYAAESEALDAYGATE